jgi:hypothetical protein
MSWADTQAVVAVIQTVPVLATAVYVTKAPAPPAGGELPLPYVIVHPNAGRDAQPRFSGPLTLENPQFTFHIVGASANQVQVVLDLVKPQFHSNGFVAPPAVAGRVNKNGYWQMPIPIQVDQSVIPSLVFAVIQCGWTSEPA